MASWMGVTLVAGLAGAGLAGVLVRRHRSSLAVGLCLLVQAAMLLFVLVGRALGDPTGQAMAMIVLGALPMALIWLNASPAHDGPGDHAAPPASYGEERR